MFQANLSEEQYFSPEEHLVNKVSTRKVNTVHHCNSFSKEVKAKQVKQVTDKSPIFFQTPSDILSSSGCVLDAAQAPTHAL